MGLDRVEREMVRENGQRTASDPESKLNLLPEVSTEVLPEVLQEAFSSLSRYEKLLRPRLSESDMTVEDSQRQEASSHDAFPPSSLVPEVPTLAETRGKNQGRRMEAPGAGAGVQGGAPKREEPGPEDGST